eukprot:7939030-Lingulodinium_polyedra.AAC.1
MVLSFRRWIQWRAGPGRRARGAATISVSESELWKHVMEELHGPDWRAQLPRPVAGAPTGDGPAPAAV